MKIWERTRRILFVFGLLTVLPSEAHNRSQSFSSWSFENKKLDLVFSVKPREATRLQSIYGLNLEDSITRHLGETIRVSQGLVDCPLDNVRKPEANVLSSAKLSVSAAFNCTLKLSSSKLNIEVGSFFSVIPSHTHYARIFFNDSLPLEHLYTDNNRVREFDLENFRYSELSGRTFYNFMSLGIQHILSGPDHIFFFDCTSDLRNFVT